MKVYMIFQIENEYGNVGDRDDDVVTFLEVYRDENTCDKRINDLMVEYNIDEDNDYVCFDKRVVDLL